MPNNPSSLLFPSTPPLPPLPCWRQPAKPHNSAANNTPAGITVHLAQLRLGYPRNKLCDLGTQNHTVMILQPVKDLVHTCLKEKGRVTTVYPDVDNKC